MKAKFIFLPKNLCISKKCRTFALDFNSCIRVSLTRPAPSKLPQALTGARVGGCSGAM